MCLYYYICSGKAYSCILKPVPHHALVATISDKTTDKSRHAKRQGMSITTIATSTTTLVVH